MAIKSDTAFRTIGEVAAELGVPQHRLRFWESRFRQLRPVQRAGQRRYYRPEDVALVRRIHRLLGQDGYTIRGVQQLLKAEGVVAPAPLATADSLIALRDRLAALLAKDASPADA